MMRKAAIIAGVLGFALMVTACSQGKNPDAPEPYIKFSGSKISFAENIPDCH